MGQNDQTNEAFAHFDARSFIPKALKESLAMKSHWAHKAF